MFVLGMSCDYHDAAAALIHDGRIVAAVEEERLSRVKHDASLPEQAVASCLAKAGIHIDQVDHAIFHEKPMSVISRVVAASQQRGPQGLSGFSTQFPVLLKRNMMIAARADAMFRRLGASSPPPLQCCEHHLSHAAAAFYPSPFRSAAILTIDGIGEWSTATIGRGIKNRVDVLEEQRYPNSLGLLYSLVTKWCGFPANDGEYKVMGLAPFGRPHYLDALHDLMSVSDDGGLGLDGSLAGWWSGGRRAGRHLAEILDGPPHPQGAPPTQREADLAASIQRYTEATVLSMAHHAHDVTGEQHVVFAGGVALNCVANGRVLREGPFDDLWVQPAAGDAGSAMGAALWWWHQHLGNPRELRKSTIAECEWSDGMSGGALGPEFHSDEIASWIEGLPKDLCDRVHRPTDLTTLCTMVAQSLSEGAVVAWFDGAMEFGPRALGHRSILADPRSSTAQRDLNDRVKGRESFRPFAPAVLWEFASDWFEIDRPAPYMVTTHQVRSEHLHDVDEEPDDFVGRVQVPRSDIPACTHIDGSARVQTVHREITPRFHRLLESFHEATGCPVLVNTSFNRAGEPIVCSPDQALSTAETAGIDLLVLGDFVIDLSGSYLDVAESAALSGEPAVTAR